MNNNFLIHPEALLELQNALLSAFPVRSMLEMFATNRLGVPLSSITLGKENLTHDIFKVIEWAKSNGKLDELISSAILEKNGNEDLQHFHDKYSLYQILSGIPNILEHGKVTANQVTPTTLKKEIHTISNLWQLISKLADFPIQYPGKSSLLINFVTLIIKTGEIYANNDELKDWMMAYGIRKGFTTDEINQVLKTTSIINSAKESTYLLVEIIPDRYQNTFFLNIFGWIDETTIINLEPLARTSIPIGKIPEEINHAIKVFSDYVLDPDNVRLEVFLPLSLLDSDIDQWEIDQLDLPLPIGAFYCVVVRSLDRILNRSLLGRTIARWKLLSESPERPKCCNLVSIFDKDEACSENFHLALRQSLNVVCVGLLDSSDSELQKNQILKKLLIAGIPIALWQRDTKGNINSSDVIRKGIRDVLFETDLIALPESIKAMRLDAKFTGPQHHGNYLSLLWDDPQRIPPNPELKAP